MISLDPYDKEGTGAMVLPNGLFSLLSAISASFPVQENQSTDHVSLIKEPFHACFTTLTLNLKLMQFLLMLRELITQLSWRTF